MKVNDAVALIRPAVPATGGTWADLGAGEGTFTRALAVLTGPQSRIFAVDRDPRALRSLRALADTDSSDTARVIPVEGDILHLGSIPELEGIELDGILFSNSLHFVPDAERVLADAARLLRPGGSVVVVEYADRPSSRWVPHPVSTARLQTLAAHAGLEPPVVVGRHPSAFGGDMYCAAMSRPQPQR